MAAAQQLFVGGLGREAPRLDLAAHAARNGALARPVEDTLATRERAAAGAAVAGVAGLDPARVACVSGHGLFLSVCAPAAGRLVFGRTGLVAGARLGSSAAMPSSAHTS